MAFQAAPLTIKVEMIGQLNGQPVVNVLHVKSPTPIVEADLISVANAFELWWKSDIRPYQVPAMSLEMVKTTDISVANGAFYENVLTENKTGTLNAGPIGANSAIVISWRTATAGRSFRGRSYIGGLGQTLLANANTVQTSTAAGLAFSGANIISILEGLGYKLVVVSRYANKVLRVVALVTEIIGVIVNTKLDTQRRRTAN